MIPTRLIGSSSVSMLAIGTAALGQAYAGQNPPPSVQSRIGLLQKAFDAGVTLVDTSPSYLTENLVGAAIRRYPMVRVATKVEILDGFKLVLTIDASRRALGRFRLDIVQLANPTGAVFADGRALEALHNYKDKGIVRYIGASVYTPMEALLAIKAGVDMVQVPYNLLDQRVRRSRIFSIAQAADVSVVTRSCWLQGALVGRADVPQRVRQAATLVRRRMGASWGTMPAVALRFALSVPVTAVLVGIRTDEELEQALAAVEAGPLGVLRQTLARTIMGFPDEVDPRRWSEVVRTLTPEDAA